MSCSSKDNRRNVEKKMPVIVCPAGHEDGMELRPEKKQSKDQLWCGVWYDCLHLRCDCSVLIPSKELKEYAK